MARFAFTSAVLVLFLVFIVRRASCTAQDRPRGIVLGSSNEFINLPEFRQAQYVSNGARVPSDVMAELGVDQFASSADLQNGFFHKVRDLLASVVDRTGAGSTPALDMTRLRQDGLKLLQDLGLWDPQEPGQIDLEEMAEAVGKELRQFVGIQAWRNVSANCLNNTLQFFEDASISLPYTGQMISSDGELINRDFVYNFNIASLGNVEMCQSVKEWNPDAPYETQYCNLAYPVLDFYAVIGLCFPANCSVDDLQHLFQPVPFIGPYIGISCVGPYPWEPWAIVTVCILCFFLLLVTMGTVYHVMIRRRIQASMAKVAARVEERDDGQSDENSLSKAEIELQYGSNRTASVVVKKDLEANGHAAHHNNGFVDVEGDVADSKETITRSEEIRSQDNDRAAKHKMKTFGLLDNIMMGFSSIHNGSKILNTEQTAGNLGVLNGIRVISMWWIILGHTVYFMIGYWDDFRYVSTTLSKSFLFSVIINAGVSVDTFFFLSGLLLTYLTLKHLQKANGRLNWFLFYLHRFIRITPAYMVSIAIWASLAIHFGQGVGKHAMFEGAAEACRKYWWTNLLYINNLYPFPGDLSLQCLGWSWYLANDMQFFVISPVIIYLLYKNAKWGMGLIMTLCLASFGVTAYIAAYYGAGVGLIPAYNNNTLVVYGSATADIIYGKPYCRIPAYLVGMVFGYIFYKVQGKPFKMSKCFNLSMWFVSTAVALSVVYGIYRDEGELPLYAAVLYNVFARPAFVTAVGWVAFSCLVGYGGPVNALLSWGFWAPLSRITFGAYLLHPIIIYTIYTSNNAQYHFTYMQWVCMFLANLVLGYAAAFVLSIGVEGPIMGLEKALLGGGARGKKK
ncbi:nose resistant to fluoxetine protein 6-like isoform X2 [Patiria miniata]|uniref:Acyltransferase 3 domain-containing protein n=1 Tax=Patiria miniata TaxID=46514 RepID=A0A913ZI15_PATMI|nr:nose resistant to fluoxetine protein 6-like isoform X2 [Patiria miniata]